MTLTRAAIVAPIRTAVGKFGGSLSSLGAGELGAVVLKALMERTKIDPARVDDVVFSQGYGNAEAPAIGHWSWLAAGLPLEVPGYQLDRRCGSGLQAVINAAMMVQTGQSDVVVAGGVESMSNVEYYTLEGRRGNRAGGMMLHDRLTRGPPHVAAHRALRRHLRHDRNRRKPRARLQYQPRGMRCLCRAQPPACRRSLEKPDCSMMNSSPSPSRRKRAIR